METSNQIDKIIPALISIQNDLQGMLKDQSGYGYKYVALDSIIEMIKPHLLSRGLSITQLLTTIEGRPGLATMLIHDTGQYIKDSVVLPSVELKGTNAGQNMGAAITYMRRYAIASLLMIAESKDVDGNHNTYQKIGSHQYKPNQSKSGNTVNTSQGDVDPVF